MVWPGQEVQMVEEGKDYGGHAAGPRKRTPSPTAELGRLGNQFGHLSLQGGATFNKLRAKLRPDQDKGQSQGKN